MIRNTWYALGPSSDIGPELTTRTIAGESLVMYRTSDGRAVALEDRCPHRHVPLSEGRLVGDDVQCGYHGMKFDCSGACVEIPGQAAIPRAAQVRSLPLVERDTLAWGWFGDPADADPALIPDYSICASPDWVGQYQYRRLRSDFWLGIENFLDPSHVTYVHPETLQSQAISTARPDVHVEGERVTVRREVEREQSSPLFASLMGTEFIDRVQDCVYWPVGNGRIESTVYPHGRRDQAFRTVTTGLFSPETDDTSHFWVGIYRDFALEGEEFSELTQKSLTLILDQDVDIVDAAYANMRDDRPVVRLEVDRGWTAARRILDKRLAADAELEAAKAEAAAAAVSADAMPANGGDAAESAGQGELAEAAVQVR